MQKSHCELLGLVHKSFTWPQHLVQPPFLPLPSTSPLGALARGS